MSKTFKQKHNNVINGLYKRKSINGLHKRKSINGLHKRKSINGFTIVELVIVIAVIAILAGVLVPTFSSIIRKAKQGAIIENTRNRYVEYFTEYGGTDGFIDDVIIKHKEVDCVVFINGLMLDDIYTLEEALNIARKTLDNQNLKVKTTDKFNDVLLLTEEGNVPTKEEIVGFSPVQSILELQNNTEIIIMYQSSSLFPDFTYIGPYNNENNVFEATRSLEEASIFTIVKEDNYWFIKSDDKYLYMIFDDLEHDMKVYYGDYDSNNKEDYLWDIEIIDNQTIIKTKKVYNGYNYYFTYYSTENVFRCHFGVKDSIVIYIPFYFE